MAIATTNVAFTGIQTEFGGSNPVALSEYYRGGTYVPTGTANGGFGLIATSGAITVGTFRGAAAFVGFTAVWGNAGQGQTAYYLAVGNIQVYVFWLTTGASVSYVTIAGDSTHWGANNSSGSVSFTDSSVAYPGTTKVTATKVLSAYNSGGTLLNTITFTYYILPYGNLTSASWSYNNATNLATLSYTTNGFCDHLSIDEDRVAFFGANSYYNNASYAVPGANVAAGTPITSSLTWTVNSFMSRLTRIYCPSTGVWGGTTGLAVSPAISIPTGTYIVARYYRTSNAGNGDYQYYLNILFGEMSGSSGNFNWAATTVSGTVVYTGLTSGVFNPTGSASAFIQLGPATTGVVRVTITKTGYNSWTQTYPYS